MFIQLWSQQTDDVTSCVPTAGISLRCYVTLAIICLQLLDGNANIEAQTGLDCVCVCVLLAAVSVPVSVSVSIL